MLGRNQADELIPCERMDNPQMSSPPYPRQQSAPAAEPPQNGWIELYRRIQWLEWQSGQLNDRSIMHGQDIRKVREEMEEEIEALERKLEEARQDREAMIKKVFYSVMGLVGAAMFKGVWELLTHIKP